METADGEPCVGIPVSNGREVVATDADGSFALADEGRFVVVSRPDGFAAEPWWVPATDNEIHFTLVPEHQPLPYEFVHLTDTHVTIAPGEPGREQVDRASLGMGIEGSYPHQLTDFLARLDQLAPGARSVMITGDLVDHGLPVEYEAYQRALSASPVPVHLIPGNHDHMNGAHGFVLSRNNYLTNEGTTENYERFIGPRWYSFTVAGLHVVAMDWHSHELGLDHEVQNEWMRNDLAMLPEGSPWILLFHDQANFSLLDHVPWLPIAAFSGHWHTSRVVEVDGTLHVNSPTTFFASLDYSPPAYRRVTWDGESISLATQTLLSTTPSPALGDVNRSTFAATPRTLSETNVVWHAQLSGAGHRQPVAVAGDLVLAGSQIEDHPAGTVEAFDLRTGEPAWRAATPSAVKTAPVVFGDLVIAAEVSGDVAAWDLKTGAPRWRVPSSDPLRRFGWGAPTLAAGRVYVGDQADLRCLDAATGEVLWRRTDLSPHHNLVHHAAPLIVDGLLVMGFWPTPSSPIGIDAATGKAIWSTSDEPDEAEEQTFMSAKQLLVMGTASYDPEADAVVMPRFAGTASVRRDSGELLWNVDHPGRFSPATPLVTPGGYVATVAGHGIRMLDSETGETAWELTITGDAPFPMSSYAKLPHPVIAAPLLVDDTLLLPGLDGTIRRIGLDGLETGRAQLSAPIAAPLTEAGGLLLAVGVDGGIRAVRREIAS
ncbi:outer membrane protein assembly factor BamB family protein [Okibacterium endophyticum]